MMKRCETEDGNDNTNLKAFEIFSEVFDDEFGDGNDSSLGALMNLIKISVGSGILSLPYLFYKVNVFVSVLVFMLTSLLLYYSYLNLIKIKESYRQSYNLTEMINDTLGQTAANLFIIQVALGGYSAPISYLIIIYEFFNNVLYNSLYPDRTQKLLYVSIAFIIIVPLTFINSFKNFSKFSALANFSTLVCLIIIIIDSTMNDEKVDQGILTDNEFNEINLVIGSAMFSYITPVYLSSVQNSMAEPSKFKKTFTSSMIIVSSLNIIFPTIVGLGYNRNLERIVLFNLYENSLSEWTQIIYGIVLIFTFSIVLFTIFEQIESNQTIKNYISFGTDGYLVRRGLLRLFQVIVISIISLFLSNLTAFISLNGSFSFVIQAFLYPMLLYYKKLHSLETFPNKLRFWSITLFGFALSLFVVVISLIQLIKDSS